MIFLNKKEGFLKVMSNINICKIIKIKKCNNRLYKVEKLIQEGDEDGK
jgi:hypothetical protein